MPKKLIVLALGIACGVALGLPALFDRAAEGAEQTHRTETIAVGKVAFTFPMPKDCVMLKVEVTERKTTKSYDCPEQQVRVRFALEERGTDWRFFVDELEAPYRTATK
jgi:hypothetical protein